MVYKAVFEVDRRFPPVFGSAVSKEIRMEALPVFFEDLSLEMLVGFQKIPGRRRAYRLGRVRILPGMNSPDNNKPSSLRARLYLNKARGETVDHSRIDYRPVVESVHVDDFLYLWGHGFECLFDYLRRVRFAVINQVNDATCNVSLYFTSDGQDPTIEVKLAMNNEDAYICMLQVMLEAEISLWIARQEQLRFSKHLYDALVRHAHHYQMSLWLNQIADGP